MVGAMLISCVATIEEMMHESDVLICGIQKGRCPREQERSGARFRMLVACADKSGNYGVQGWLHHSLRAQVNMVTVSLPD